jgi:Skp family chaperone for outer membrane proteins
MRCPDLKLTSAPGGSESEFRARLALALREKRDAAVDGLRRKYASKLDTIEDRARKAEQKLVREKEQSSQQTMSSALSVGGSLLGALFGGRRGSAFGKASSAARSVGRIGKERTDVAHAEADLTALQQQHAALEAELADEIAALESKFDAGAIAVEQSEIKARKSDTEVTDLALVWQPA